MALLRRCILIFIFMSRSWALGFHSKVTAFRSEERRVLSAICLAEDQARSGALWACAGSRGGRAKCHSLLRRQDKGWGSALEGWRTPALTDSFPPEWRPGMATGPVSDRNRLHLVIDGMLGFGIEGTVGYGPSLQEAPAHWKPNQSPKQLPLRELLQQSCSPEAPPHCACYYTNVTEIDWFLRNMVGSSSALWEPRREFSKFPFLLNFIGS